LSFVDGLVEEQAEVQVVVLVAAVAVSGASTGGGDKRNGPDLKPGQRRYGRSFSILCPNLYVTSVKILP
jgi:hypothetical protein